MNSMGICWLPLTPFTTPGWRDRDLGKWLSCLCEGCCTSKLLGICRWHCKLIANASVVYIRPLQRDILGTECSSIENKINPEQEVRIKTYVLIISQIRWFKRYTRSVMNIFQSEKLIWVIIPVSTFYSPHSLIHFVKHALHFAYDNLYFIVYCLIWSKLCDIFIWQNICWVAGMLVVWQ